MYVIETLLGSKARTKEASFILLFYDDMQLASASINDRFIFY